MPRAKKLEPIEVSESSKEMVAAAEVQPEEISEVIKGNSKTEFSVYRGEEVIRTYSVEIHGENAEALAHEFAANHGGEVR